MEELLDEIEADAVRNQGANLLERLATENDRLRGELDKVCRQHSLVRCSGCGDYVFYADIDDEEKSLCCGCQDEIDDDGEIGEEYRLDEGGIEG